MKKRINTDYVPLWNLVEFAKEVFKSPSGSKEEDVQVKNILKHALKLFILIGGITSMSLTATNIYSALLPHLNQYLAIFLTGVASVSILLCVDYALGIIAPYSFKYILGGKVQKNIYTKSAGVLLLMLTGVLSFVTMSLSTNNADNVAAVAIGDVHAKSVVLAEMKTNSSITSSMDDAIAMAKVSDNEGKSAIRHQQHIRVQYYRNKYGERAANGNVAAKSKVNNALSDSSKAVAKFKPTVLALIQKKMEIIENEQHLVQYQVEAQHMSNDGLKDKHDKKAKQFATILKVVGVSATAIALLICLILTLLEVGDEKPETNRGETADSQLFRKKTVMKPISRNKTDSVSRNTSQDVSVSLSMDDETKERGNTFDLETFFNKEEVEVEAREYSASDLRRKAQQNANFCQRIRDGRRMGNHETPFNNVQDCLDKLKIVKGTNHAMELKSELEKSYGVTGLRV